MTSQSSVYLSGSEIRAALQASGFDPTQMTPPAGMQITGFTAGGYNLVDDPYNPSPIAVQLSMRGTPESMQPAAPPPADPAMQQRRAALAGLRRFASRDPRLLRNKRFWNTLAAAEAGAALTPRQRNILRLALPPVLRQNGPGIGRRRLFPQPLFRQTALITLTPPVMAANLRLVLGEKFEEWLLGKLITAPTPNASRPKPRAAGAAAEQPQPEFESSAA